MGVSNNRLQSFIWCSWWYKLNKINRICKDFKKTPIKIGNPQQKKQFDVNQFNIIGSIAKEEGIKQYIYETLGLPANLIDTTRLKEYFKNTECIKSPMTKKRKVVPSPAPQWNMSQKYKTTLAPANVEFVKICPY